MSTSRKLVEVYSQEFYSKPKPFSLLAFVVDSCGYACEYCYNHFPRTGKKLDLDKLKAFADEVVFRKLGRETLCLDLIGGETLLHPDLGRFCRELASDKRIETSVYSNFSLPWEKYAELLDAGVHLLLSWHSCCDGEAFREKFTKLAAAGKLGQTTLSVMFEHSASDACLEAFDWFAAKFPELREIELITLDENENYAGVDYTPKQMEQFAARSSRVKSPTTKLVYSDGTSELVDDNYFFRHPSSTDFRRWMCNAGLDFFFVYFDGSVHPCDENDGIVLFNVETGNPASFVPPTRPVFCQRSHCPCLFDLYKRRAFAS